MASGGFRQWRPRDREGVPVWWQEGARDLDDLFARDGAQLARIALEVIGAEIEHLGLQDEAGDAARALADDVELADELILREQEVVGGDLAVADLAQLVEG